jgi:hypothetical protein
MLKVQRNKNEVTATFTSKAGYSYDFDNVVNWFSKLIKSRLEDEGYKSVSTKVSFLSNTRHFCVAVGNFKKSFFNHRLNQLMDLAYDASIDNEQAIELLDKSKKMLSTILNEVENAFTPFSVEDDETDDDEIYVGVTYSITSDDAGNLNYFLGETPTLGFFDFLNRAVSSIVGDASIWAETSVWTEGGAVRTRTPSNSYTHKKLYEAYLNASKSCTEQAADLLAEEVKYYLQDLKLDAQEISDDDDWIITVTV